MYRLQHIEHKDSVSDLWITEEDPDLRSIGLSFSDMVNSGDHNVHVSIDISEDGLTKTNNIYFETEADWHIWRATSVHQDGLTYSAKYDNITISDEVTLV